MKIGDMKFLPLILAGLIGAGRAYALDSAVVINEIHYNPATGQTEFVELRNLQGVDISLAGWRLSGGIDYTFPQAAYAGDAADFASGAILPAHGYIVVAANPALIPGSIGPFTGALSNGGETLRLRNNNDRIISEVSYDDEGDWPVGPDGSGFTLARRDADGAPDVTSWTVSSQPGGTPGSVNFSTGEFVDRTLVATRSSWKYTDADTAPPANWNTAAFSDAAWSQGAAPFGTGTASSPTLTVTTDLVERFRAGAVTGVADGATVTTWTDLATGDGSSQNAVAGTTTPTLKLNATPNGKAALRFDGNDEMRTTLATGIAGTGGFCYFIVMKANGTMASGANTDGGGAYIFDRSAAGNPLVSLKVTGSNYGFQKRFGDGSGLGGPSSTTAISQSAFQIVTLRRNRTANRFEIWVNGVMEATEADSGGSLIPDPINIARHSTGTTQGLIGEIAELLIYKNELSAANFEAVGSYLEAEYGVDSAFPGVSFATGLSSTAPTAYFRQTFNYPGAPERTTLRLDSTVADGAVFYLNGTELKRENMAAGLVSHTTPALGNIASPAATGFLSVPATALVSGQNILAASLHKAAGSTDTYLNAALEATEAPENAANALKLVFSEITSAGDPSFFVELQNASALPLDTTGWTVRTDLGQSAPVPAQSLAAGARLTINAAALGFTPVDGTRLFVLSPGGSRLTDARAVTARLRGLTADGRWGHPDAPTPGAANVVTVNSSVVINEIFYNAMNDGPEQWLELHNKGAVPVDLSGWKFSDGVSFTFPAATTIAPGGYLVVAWDPAAFAVLHPGVSALGPWSGSLSGSGEQLTLRDANDNVVDQLSYHDGGLWSQWADGGGSSLELIDPDADNSRGGAWDASDESSKGVWQNVTYSGLATNNPGTNPTDWHEFCMGLLNGGEYLIDDISVKNVTGGNVELIQNGNFSAGTAAFWRIIGTHSGTVVDDPDTPGNKVLKVSATAETEHMANHATTSLKAGATFHTISPSNNYSISFRARWVRGSNRLHTRLWVNRLARQTLLTVPATGGTPGAVNSRFAANAGPTFDALNHFPAVPAAATAATVSVRCSDPDGLAGVVLFSSVNGGAFTSTAMTASGSGLYEGTVPGQAAGALVNFYVQATDSLGAVSVFPPGGAAAHAMIPWKDTRAQLTLATGVKPHNFRVVMPGLAAREMYKQENYMSNASVPCTVIVDENRIYYRAGVSLKSSEHGRFNITRVGYNMEFPPDGLLNGVHGGISMDRSGGTSAGQKEILVKTLSNIAGGVYAPEDEIIRLIPAVASAASPALPWDGAGMLGPAILSKTRLKGDFLDGQWDDGGSGMMFKYERIYVLTQTINPTTRAVDASPVRENPKIPQDTTGPPGVAVTNLGADKEIWRWYWLVESGRDRDDYSGMINVATACGQGQGTAAFNTQTAQYIDVDQWMRAHIPSVLFGVVDNYMGSGGGQHNALFYFPPGGGKCQLFPWDLDFLSQGTTTASLTTGTDVTKFLANPAYRRLYYGHLLDVLNRSFNSPVMTRWAAHYSKFSVDDMTGVTSSYLTPRSVYARSVVTGTNGQTAPVPVVAFARTSLDNQSVTTAFATVTGTGWIDIDFIRLQGSPEPLAVTWTGQSAWSLQLPLLNGTNTYTLEAVKRDGTVATTTVTVTTTGGILPASANNLVVSELHYNPPLPTPAEITAGFTSRDDFEFIELQNIAANTVDLTNCRFDGGITYAFAAGTQIPAGGRVVIPRRTAAFAMRHTGVTTLAQYYVTADPTGNQFSNGGEEIALLSAAGPDVQRFTYDDAPPWPAAADGAGSSLVLISPMANPDHSNPLSWRASSVTNGAPGAAEGTNFTGDPNGDADGDGLNNLADFAIGAGLPPAATLDGTPGAPAFTFTLDRDTAANVSHTIETSTDLTSQPVTGWTMMVSPVLLSRTAQSGTVERLVYSVPLPPGTSRAFIRARFTAP